MVCGSIQSVALNLDKFKDSDFDYLIIDEAHHASADTYQKVLAYFKPQFTLGLTATPERTDDNTVILDIFKNTAHKLDIQTAVEIGELVPVRCIRIHTNIDLTKVRFNSVQYNIRDLESKIYVPERNRLIIDTWLQYVKNRRTVVFCASVKHGDRELFHIQSIFAFHARSGDYWHICFEDGSGRTYEKRSIKIEVSCLGENKAGSRLDYLRQLAAINELKSDDGTVLLEKQYEKLTFVGQDTAMAVYLDPTGHCPDTRSKYTPIFPFGGNASQFHAKR